MNKLMKLCMLIMLTTIISISSYAENIYISIETGVFKDIGTTYSRVPHPLSKGYQPARQKNVLSPYISFQWSLWHLGSDTTNFNYYLHLASIREFQGGFAPALMAGFGLETTLKRNDNLSHVINLELHQIEFGMPNIPEHAEGNPHYKGFGAIVSYGVLLNKRSFVKAIFLHNYYEINDSVLYKRLPRAITAQYVGVSIGYAFY